MEIQHKRICQKNTEGLIKIYLHNGDLLEMHWLGFFEHNDILNKLNGKGLLEYKGSKNRRGVYRDGKQKQ